MIIYLIHIYYHQNKKQKSNKIDKKKIRMINSDLQAKSKSKKNYSKGSNINSMMMMIKLMMMMMTFK